MLNYIIRRLLYNIPVFLGILLFVMVALRVNDPIVTQLGKHSTQEQYDNLREKAGLDRPFIVQYASFVWGFDVDRESWDKTFDICWNGVYYCSRAFVPMLVASSEGHLINTSSVNGFWASLGPMTAHTAYSAAKFAVKGFTEALVNDFRNNAPHLKVSLVMPGHIGTSIIINSGRILGRDPKELSDEDLDEARERMARIGFPVDGVSNDQIRQALIERAESFRDDAPMTAEEAAKVILDGVRQERWRILVGEDAHVLDQLVREAPEEAYEASFV